MTRPAYSMRFKRQTLRYDANTCLNTVEQPVESNSNLHHTSISKTKKILANTQPVLTMFRRASSIRLYPAMRSALHSD
ncbi:hypothetical protein WN55_02433 [Dufourea novaeangliae]|uniref:Uncharacterized protein n=1 Tax=Dufourea novaeangliae TaxID=178035 RepID=A0A154PGV1_DUFNO|nr:hypothetical protein WN55_02433 [Dufourea novaeangliae]